MPADEETGAQPRLALAGGGVIEVGGSTVDDPETGEPVPAAVLRLPLWQLSAVAGALDMWNRVSALVMVSGGCVPADDGLGAALAQAADALVGCDRGTTRAGGVAGPDPAAARRVAVVRAHHAALDWARVITGSPLAPYRVVTDLAAAAGRLQSGQDDRDPAAVLVQCAVTALADLDASADEV